MSKSNSTALFDLIHSMKKSEKRYFRVFVQGEGQNLKYLKLFDLIEKQDNSADESSLYKAPFIKKQQLSNLKAHLYKKVLQSIRQFNHASTLDIQIREMIDHAQLLFNRGLYDQCVDMLKKARKRASKTDNLELSLEILKWEKNVLTQTVGPGNEQRVNRIISDVQDTNQRINRINKFSNLGVKLNSLFYKTGFIRDQADYQHIHMLYKEGMPDYNEDILSLNEKLSLYQVQVGFYFFIQDLEKGLLYASKWVRLFEQYPDIRYTRTNDYLNAINSLMIAQYKLHQYDKFVESSRLLREIRHYPSNVANQNIRMRLLKYTYVHEFNRIFMLGDFGHGVSLMKRIEPKLEEFIRHIDQHSRLILYYKVACLYFGNDQYRHAVIWLNRIINSENIDLREDIHSFARILNLISHYELGNMDVIDYYIRSTYRFLFRRDDLRNFQKFILSFLKRMNATISNEELISEFDRLRNQLITLQNNPYEKRAFTYFDIISWLESKTEIRPVAEIVREKSEKLLREQRQVAV